MAYTLLIAEKPQAASKIADALADTKPVKENISGIPYYRLTHNNKEIVVVCAVGHLYNLAQKEGKKWTYPIFDIEWKESASINKNSAFTKKYLTVIKKMAKEADAYVVCCDYDQEGSVIGMNVIKYACKQKDAARMKFSTLTKAELVKAFETKSPTLDWGQANAGETRHYLDYYWGINTSRALTSAIKASGMFKVMSTGRVQGPSLKLIVDREKEIKAFKPVPFWQIELIGDVKEGEVDSWHKKDKFWDKKQADTSYTNAKDCKTAVVDKAEKKQFKQAPPIPFDLTSLQMESYRCFRISPKDTLAVAQQLYLAGVISYPRTSSQQLPEVIGFSKIMDALTKQNNYKELVTSLLKKGTLKPNNGKKTDAAHPAIYPTGIFPKDLDPRKRKLYDLIVKRFLATFSDPALRETMTIDINANNELFIAKGTRTVEKGWHVYYTPYVKLEEQQLPAVNKGDSVTVKKVQLHNKETQPPKRYTPASIIKELERKNLGTKATRSQIIETLFNRGYARGKVIEATELGIRTAEALEKSCPKILDEKLTRHFEDEMQDIVDGKEKEGKVLSEAKDVLMKVLTEFKQKEKEIGMILRDANIRTIKDEKEIGVCPVCKEGKLTIKKGKTGYYGSCTAYPECKTIFSMPSGVTIKETKEVCEECSFPIITVVRRRRTQKLCVNPKCPSKHIQGEAGEEAAKIENGELKKQCPKCKKGTLVLRSSIYGKFYGCSSYPKCKNTQAIENGKKEEKP
ncbi:MAG: DNA topoisomerase I [Candidatus Woesearchaeota archaeon]|jgi:DNA topoisomerase-1|nr:DNA topoisomerase I [Candidatus Woesearchaeota archaeon]MDP7506340.1 DNA topoisomerase I [Candidatus Woesearchaeota archaeon]|tara:strand:- start:4506 stop:6731 length:2226 start_codon:yes stop_codon:yes gene_type:complete